MAAKKQSKTLPMALKLLAGLVFLYVVFASPLAGTTPIGAGILWVPLLYAVAVLSSVALFVSSLVGFGWNSDRLSISGNKAMELSALALLALTVTAGRLSLSLWGSLIVLGFVIGWIG